MRKQHHRPKSEATEKKDKMPRPIFKGETLVEGLL
jgi:hypothetical protein